jgi:hypothetical protein
MSETRLHAKGRLLIVALGLVTILIMSACGRTTQYAAPSSPREGSLRISLDELGGGPSRSRGISGTVTFTSSKRTILVVTVPKAGVHVLKLAAAQYSVKVRRLEYNLNSRACTIPSTVTIRDGETALLKVQCAEH